ncbi:methyl-accepting chemotaxis protein [Aquabacterium sp. CECT 9606]|uniref:methyl-accepting chemotaxis protein n=1 Tax=Aquabacterium sp. CECT 9606 TaxID=2845822 RepID=UPI002739AA5B|nr:methyl-accepting chemotaxis protein [Aquabacterium sp. CECT 9606]
MFKNLKITTRLTATLALLVSIIVGLSGLALWQMGKMRTSTYEITSNWLPSVSLVNAMNTNTSDFRLGEVRHVLSTDDAEMAQIEKDIAVVKAGFDKNHDAYIKLISSDEERKLYESFAADWKSYLAMHEQLIAASRKNETERARVILNKETLPVYDRFSATLLKLVELNNKGGADESVTADRAYAQARTSLLVGVVAALGIAVVAGWWLVRSIARPLANAVTAADRAAAGDFTQAIQADGDDEAAQVLKALARMQVNLTNVVSGVRANSESVSTASAQIAQGNQDLSQRTEEQASALQQTAATMEQLNTTVRNNADNAKQANQLAQGASEIAAQGGEVVGQVVTTMQGISDSSRKIGDIIGVIDGIAFQTNILALNAAVEAARAGEQGRGFAVVASEVRTLAQRSAEAAKEIKTLIGRSVEQVEQGTVLVDQAGKTMGEIVGSIRRVSDIVAEISSASQEQSDGITQVGNAVGQMDQVTQQNAALVEESAAAAESLKGQAQQLVQSVAVFKLPSDRAGQPSYLSSPAANAQVVERRGPERAKPAARPSKSPQASSTASAAALTGADDWTSF